MDFHSPIQKLVSHEGSTLSLAKWIDPSTLRQTTTLALQEDVGILEFAGKAVEIFLLVSLVAWSAIQSFFMMNGGAHVETGFFRCFP